MYLILDVRCRHYNNQADTLAVDTVEICSTYEDGAKAYIKACKSIILNWSDNYEDIALEDGQTSWGPRSEHSIVFLDLTNTNGCPIDIPPSVETVKESTYSPAGAVARRRRPYKSP